MIFDYILNNRFYAPDESLEVVPDSSSQDNEPANPYIADIIPKAPHNRLETFLNMIVGDIPLDGYAAVDPIKPISEMEYWLNEIAAAKDGNPWRDASSGLEAKLVTAQFAEDVLVPMYMLDLDLGIDEFPYTINRMWFTVEGDHYRINAANSLSDEPMPLVAENTYGIIDPYTLQPADPEKSTELSNEPGIFVVEIYACLYQLAGETIHAQMFFTLMEGDGDFDGVIEHLYTNADSVVINASFDYVEDDKS